MTKIAKNILLGGEIFGDITFIRYAGKMPDGRAKGEFKCFCGNFFENKLYRITSGGTKSCGCLLETQLLKHGMTNTPEYEAWLNFRRRCYEKNNKRYKTYGGRGIKVCDRWLGYNGFENFFSDMGVRPSPKHSIDRIDNNKDYCPENCKWSTIMEQVKRKTNNVNVTYNGITKNLTDWSRDLGLSRDMLRGRFENNWPVDKMFTYPSGMKKNATI